MKKMLAFVAIMSTLASCNRGDHALKLHSTRDFLNTLNGSWFLKNYTDSVGKGFTPGPLRGLFTDYYFMLLNREDPYYHTDMMEDSIFIIHLGDEQFESRYQLTLDTIEGVAYITNFETAYDPDSTDPATDTYVAHYKEKDIRGVLRFFTSGADTLVQLSSENRSKRPFNQTFRKITPRYACSFSSNYTYSDYVADQFIAGDYQVVESSAVAAGTGVYFSNCGETNAYNLLYKPSDTFSRFYLSAREDRMGFDCDSAKISAEVGWRREGDTLLLTDPDNGLLVHHKLVKTKKTVQ